MWLLSTPFYLLTDDDIEPGTSLENVAVVKSETHDPRPLDNTAVADTSIISEADLEITKDCPDDPVNAGKSVTCTITVTNHGPSIAQNVDVKDVLPPGFTFDSGVAIPEGTCVSGICQLNDVGVGVDNTVTIEITAMVESDVEAGLYTNTATVFTDFVDPGVYPNTDTDDISVATLADLSISKFDLSDPVGPTDGLVYKITVNNAGPSDAQDVLVVDELDPNVTFSNADPACYQSAEFEVRCEVDTLPAGQGIDFLIAVSVKDINPDDYPLLNNHVEVSSPTDPTGDSADGDHNC